MKEYMKKENMSGEFIDVLETIGYEDDVRITEYDYSTFMFFNKLLTGLNK